MRRRLAAALMSSVIALAPLTGCAGDDALDSEGSGFPDGKADGGVEEGSPEALAILGIVNTAPFEELDDDAKLHRTAAQNIVDQRNGPDGELGTADDNLYDTLAELDAVLFVGPVALQALFDYAVAKGLITAGDAPADVIFSPKNIEDSHNARVADLIDGAQHSIDIAMYSYSDAKIAAAIKSATARGVKMRFIFETANADRKKEGDDLKNTKSGRLERDGVDVRWVNKIMHHKYAIIDGPRDDLERADTATIVSGSANWSFGGATRYDENTIFETGNAELTLGLQREFNLMWEHSRDFVHPDHPKQFVLSSLQITDSMIPDNPNFELLLTSPNFDVSEGSTTFRVDKTSTVMADALVEAIQDADTSIWVAEGHLRLRPVALALIEKHEQNPDMDIRVYLDAQEYISNFGNNKQLDKQEACLETAVTDTEETKCLSTSFLYGKMVHDSGINIRYKYYSFRWHFSYAVQMHDKFLIIDGDELYTGSYNLSMNAEQNTFENVFHYSGDEYSDLIAQYEQLFLKIFNTGRSEGMLADLREEVATASLIPIVFQSISLTWDEVTSLKSLIRANCSQINSVDFRTMPERHHVCPR